MFFGVLLLLLIALTAADLLLGKNIGATQRKVMHATWVIAAILMAASMPSCGKGDYNPGEPDYSDLR